MQPPGTPYTRHRDATLISVLAYSGVRPQEALALRWGDVRERTLLIERAISAGRVAPTKTRKARTVRLLEPLAADLREFRMAAGRPAADQLIFPGHDGSHWTKTTWDNWRERTFARLLANVGLAGAVPYDLRHSFASLLLHEGRSVHHVARQLGHSPRLTLETYGHVIDELDHAPRLAAVDAIMQAPQRPASRASGPDRIVGVMSASGSYDTMPSNCGRGATMGPPACSAQSSPVVFRARRCSGLQGLIASWDDWRRQKVSLIRKRSQVRVLDRPLAGIQEFAAFTQFSRIWLLEDRHVGVFRGATMGPPAVTGERQSARGFRAAVASVLGGITAGTVVIGCLRVFLSVRGRLPVGGCPGVVAPLLEDRLLPSAGGSAVACDRCPLCGGLAAIGGQRGVATDQPFAWAAAAMRSS